MNIVAKNLPKLPDLVETQYESFCSFLSKGFQAEFANLSPIVSYNGRLSLHFSDESFRLKIPFYHSRDMKRRDYTFSAQICVNLKLRSKANGLLNEDEIFITNLPIMNDRGSFIINGVERVVINQLVRSPGVYFKSELSKFGKRLFSASIIARRGSWLRFEMDKNGFFWVRVDKTRKLNAYFFLRAVGLTDEEVFSRIPVTTLVLPEKKFCTEEIALQEVYKELYPNEPMSVLGSQNVLYSRFFDKKRYDLSPVGRYKLNQRLFSSNGSTSSVLTKQDCLETLASLYQLSIGDGFVDDIDNFSNRRIRSVGEHLEVQTRQGLMRLEKIARERMAVCDLQQVTVKRLIDPKPVNIAIRDLFISNPLSQFMDQTNPLAELTHKRRITTLGPGGLNKDRVSFAIRDVHPTCYGRVCPIETPEGANAGLVSSLTSYAKVNSFGFIEAPFHPVENSVVSFGKTLYLSADKEEFFKIAETDTLLDENNTIVNEWVSVRYKHEFITVARNEVDFIGVSLVQNFSIATALIPFLEHDDGNRALMGSNMQRQAVPLLSPERPIVGTGFESQIARDSGMVLVCRVTGTVVALSANFIKIELTDTTVQTYVLKKYERSNQDTCINQRPLVSLGDHVVPGQLLAQSSAMDQGEMALGQNVLLAYMPWEGFNYEDAFLVSERLVYDNLFTSIHIEKYDLEVHQTKYGSEKITREVPNTSEESLRFLDKNGIVLVGTYVAEGDILVGKVSQKNEQDQPPEGKLLNAIFARKGKNVKDTSLRVAKMDKGRVLDISIFSRRNKDDLLPGVNVLVLIYIVVVRKVQIGDKLAGRHGNKGIISRILPRQDMPYLPDGTPVDILLNPLGVPSRMNVGQLFESLLGLAGYFLEKRFKVIPFDEFNFKESSRLLINEQLLNARESLQAPWLFSNLHPGKTVLFDGRTGEAFDNPVTVGYTYMLKLVHLVDDKIHARSTGPYSLVTQQPLGGRSQQGGQRLGEMEVWALEAYGAAYTLQELLTIKSDDMKGRNKTLNAIVKGKQIPTPGVPESFKVLLRELQSLTLDIVLYTPTAND